MELRLAVLRLQKRLVVSAGPPHDNLGPGAVSFSMIEGFGPNNASIQQLLLNAANNRGVQAHGRPTEDCVAAFLIGAGHRAYFGIGGWSERGATFEDHWMPQFASVTYPATDMSLDSLTTFISIKRIRVGSYPLGDPLADATYSQGTWTREFDKKVKVTFDVAVSG